jgi:phosphoribosylaminoimidazole-succinocarboxamide synthase
MSGVLFESNIASLALLGRGKVRDIYAVSGDRLLIVASDRLSAFDVVLPTPIANKGAVLTQMSNFWFERLQAIVPNHLTGVVPESVVSGDQEKNQVRQRAVVVKRLKALPVEAVVRGYLVGGGWKEYQQNRSVSGVSLPTGLRIAERLPAPIFTPSTKAEHGQHDENISFDQVVASIGRDLANEMRDVSIRLYREAADYALSRGIIIADTKFEFGLDDDGRLTLMDEVLTPDSSRFWPADSYSIGSNPPSFDKQYVRDYLESIHWNKQPPAPALPDEIAARTAEKYAEAFQRLTGSL